MTTLTLNQLIPGTQAKIIGFIKHENVYRQKMLAMGITPGAKLTMVRAAPLGDPLQVSVRGFQLSLRKAEAKTIIVEIIK